MRAIKLCIALTLLFVMGQAFANLDVVNNNSKLPQSQCPGDWNNQIVYIPGDNVPWVVVDEFRSNRNSYLATNSRIGIWRSDNNLLSGCTTQSDWRRNSVVAPANTWVVAVSANCVFNKPTNKDNREIQFVYNLRHASVIQKSGNSSATRNYWTYNRGNGSFQQHSITFPRYQVANDYSYHENECYNVELRYCGDGIVSHGEVCDPEDSTQTGWGNGGCDANTCQPINNPTCNALSVTPNSGTAPLDVAASCTGFKVNTWQIDCGNGQTFSGTGNNAGVQTFNRTCSYTTAGSFTPRCTINGTISGGSCQQTVTVSDPINPRINVDKRDMNVHDLDGNIGGDSGPGSDSQTVYRGERAIFQIRVTNNGSEDLRNIRLIDEVAPACGTAQGAFVDLQNRRFTNADGGITNISPVEGADFSNNTLRVGQSFIYTCRKENTQDSYTNVVAVSGTGVTSGQTVQDDDDTEVLVREAEACTGLTTTPSSARNSLTSTLTCTGNNATSFKIEVRNPSGVIVNTINTATGSVTLPLIGGVATNYSASCFVNNETTAVPACTTTLSVTTGGGGGSNHSCVDIERRNSNIVRCTGLSAFVMGITYTSSGSTLQQKQDNLATTDTGRLYADFTLPADATNIQCLASKNGLEPIAEGLQDWRGGQQCRFNENPICGDGVVDAGEQCDFGTPFSLERWGRCGLPGTANQCRFSGGGGTPPGGGPTPDCSTPGIQCGVITIPDEGVFRFGPSESVIVGYNQYPLERLRNSVYNYPVLHNDSKYDISFETFCIKTRNNNLVEVQNGNTTTPGEICVNIENKTIYPQEELYLVRDGINYKVVNQYHDIIKTPSTNHNYKFFKAKQNSVPVGESFRETSLVTSVKDTLPTIGGGMQKFEFYDTFLSSNVDVRVARPAVSTVGGGTSYVKSTTTSDVAVVTQGIAGMIGNTNFVGTSVSDSGVSSDSAAVTDTDASSGDRGMQGGITLVNPTTTSTNFVSYNGIDNVFVKSGNHSFSSTPTGNGARTYIVENGDVTITGNIETNDNIAIIVRNGNILIGKDVERINATLMILGTGNISGAASNNQLRVNGALYGNIDELIANRYYIDGSGNTLSVGTIVSFGSNLLRRPAPLLSQFVGEYLNSQRVAR